MTTTRLDARERDTALPARGDEVWRNERVDLAAERQARRRAGRHRLLTGAGGVAGLLAGWQLAAVLLDDPVILPSVVRTARTFAHYLTTTTRVRAHPSGRT